MSDNDDDLGSDILSNYEYGCISSDEYDDIKDPEYLPDNLTDSPTKVIKNYNYYFIRYYK